MSQMVRHVMTKLRKRLRLGHSLDELEPAVAERELRFRAPPLDGELLATIKRISPQFHLRADEKSRRFWELNQNGLCWGEYDALQPFLERLGPPARVLDIGPGLGRSAAFFKSLDGWETTHFDLFEGSGEGTKYTKAGPRFEDSFCGDLDVLRSVLEFNRVEPFEIHDATPVRGELAGLPGPYDFVYSFFAIGFHWSLEHFLDEILELMKERSLGAFTLHDRFEDLELFADIPHRVVRFQRSWPRGRFTRMVVLSKDESLLGEDGSVA